MKRFGTIFLSIVLAILISVSCVAPINNTTGEQKPNQNKPILSKPSNLIVFGQLKEGEYTEGKVLVGYEDRSAAMKVVELLKGTVAVDLPQIKMISIRFNGTVKEAYEKIKSANISGIKYVEPSYKRELIKPLPVDDTITKSIGAVKTTSLRGEEEFSHALWGLEAIGAPQVWSQLTGRYVTVAVVDSGVDGTHPDLAGQVIGGYRPSNNSILPPNFDSSFGGAHGTHVAGTIAARRDGKGIVGVAPDAKIMPIVIFENFDPETGDYDYVGDDEVAEGIIWAVEHGANVMNHSWGGWGYSHTLKLAFDYALDHGVIMVVSAGNDHSDQHFHYPSNYPGVIQVAAAEYHGGQYRTVWFSNRSDAITVAAPGVNILSTVPGPNSIGYEGWSVTSSANNGTYDYYQGTSMAAPHVTGVIALLLEKYPNAKPWQIRRLIQQAAIDIDEAGFDHSSGYGLINVANASVKPLPSSGGLSFDVVVTDAYEEWLIPTVFVRLKRLNGVGGDYYAKTDSNGVAHFSNIDAGQYQLILGGPDSWERRRTSEGVSRGLWAINWRMEEERQIEEIINLTSDSTKTYNFSSEFKLKLNTELTIDASVIIYNIIEQSLSEIAYTTSEIDLSHHSGLFLIGVTIGQPATETITIEATVTLNGHKISVSGKIGSGATSTILSDSWGPDAWWTVFGSN
ncbi:S8 family serine peptidase [Pseudothermotoga sp.]|uniref:S8 family serine peptidase n=1 Tax=Pseudothermotoga sp. TaxID=2033661 RepID=UPI0031F61B10